MDKRLSHPLIYALIGGAFAAGLLSLSVSSSATDANPESIAGGEQVAHVTVGAGFIDLDLGSTPEFAILRVAGPQGYALTFRVEGQSYITADLLLDAEPSAEKIEAIEAAMARGAETPGSPHWDQLPNGTYTFELMVYQGQTMPETMIGQFRVSNGNVTLIDNSLSSHDQPNRLQRFIGATLDFLVPSAHADEETINDDSGGTRGVQANNWVSIFDTANSDNTRVNFFNNSFQDLSIRNRQGSMVFGTGTGANLNETLMTFSLLGKVGIHTGSPQELLHVNHPSSATARIRISNTGSAYNLHTGGTTGFQIQEVGGGSPFRIDPGAPTSSIRVASSGNVGIGTASPASGLHSAGTTRLIGEVGVGVGPQLGTALFVRGQSDEIALRVQPGGSALTRFRVDANGGATVGANNEAPARGLFVFGNQGIGTNAPGASLHVRRSNNTARVLVEDTGVSDPSGGQTMFELRNDGHPKFMMEDTAQSNVRWEFRTAGTEGSNERFQINKLGSGVVEARIFAGGDAEFAGNVTANGVLLTSTREAKTDFAPLDDQEVLRKLASLDISQWRYKHESPDTRHFGPVAEEFHEIFGLSDGKTLNMIDTTGISFAAIRALNDENQRLARQNEQLAEVHARKAAQTEELIARLERLEATINH